MPEIRYYVVEQTREVKVTANTLVDAVRIASEAFEKGQNSDNAVKNPELEGVWGNTTTPVKETDIHAREAY